MALLDIDGLKTYYIIGDEEVKAVDGVSFRLEEGKSIGLAGESGCGKTTTVHSIMRILPPVGKIVAGHIHLEGRDIVSLSDREMNEVRWKQISIVFQAAQDALNPIVKVEDQIAEPLIAHLNYGAKEALRKARELLRLMGIDPSRGSDYPHQFSGGMKQRVCIAMALACDPKILIADEPTTALYVMVQAQILSLMKDLQKEYGLSMIYVSHDLSVLSEVCDNIAVMYAGKICESAETAVLHKSPMHPYTKKLLKCVTTLERNPEEELETIPGAPPLLINPPPGCRFQPRCEHALPICTKEDPALIDIREGHFVACHLYP